MINESTASDQEEGSSEAVVDETTTNIEEIGPDEASVEEETSNGQEIFGRRPPKPEAVDNVWAPCSRYVKVFANLGSHPSKI